MGCDYYILNVLRIYCNDNRYLSLVVDRERGYYHHVYCDDQDDYETKENEYIKHCLTPRTKPIVIYNNTFNTSTYKTKYKSIVETFMNECGKRVSDITQIVQIEERIERN